MLSGIPQGFSSKKENRGKILGQYYTPLTKQDGKRLFWGQSKEYNRNRNPKDFNGMKLLEHAHYGNRLMDAISSHIYKKPTMVVWLGDYSSEWKHYSKRKLKYHNYEVEYFDSSGKWIVNHTKKVGFRMNQEDALHPIPLLTACGNGKGNGDYYGKNRNICGIWAFNIISIEDILPEGYMRIEQPEFKDLKTNERK